LKAATILFTAFPSIRTLKFRKLIEYANPLSSLLAISISTWNGTADADDIPLLIAGATALQAYYFGTASVKNSLQLHCIRAVVLVFCFSWNRIWVFLSFSGRKAIYAEVYEYDI